MLRHGMLRTASRVLRVEPRRLSSTDIGAAAGSDAGAKLSFAERRTFYQYDDWIVEAGPEPADLLATVEERTKVHERHNLSKPSIHYLLKNCNSDAHIGIAQTMLLMAHRQKVRPADLRRVPT